MKNLDKVKTGIKKIFLKEGHLGVFQLVEIEEDLADISEMVREYAHQEMEDVILTILSFLSLSVSSVSINKLVVSNHFASFITQKVKTGMSGRQMKEKQLRSVNMQKRVSHV